MAINGQLRYRAMASAPLPSRQPCGDHLFTNDQKEVHETTWCVTIAPRAHQGQGEKYGIGRRYRSYMALPEDVNTDVLEIFGELCRKRSVEGESVVTITIRGNKVTLIEARPLFIDPNEWFDCKAAQMEYFPKSNSWKLFWFDLRNKRHEYPAGPKNTLEQLVAEIDRDPTGIFWG